MENKKKLGRRPDFFFLSSSVRLGIKVWSVRPSAPPPHHGNAKAASKKERLTPHCTVLAQPFLVHFAPIISRGGEQCPL